jgi:hypothetical protein
VTVLRVACTLDPAVRTALMDVALERRWTVWYLQLWRDGRIVWADMRWPDSLDVLTVDEYRARLVSWWTNRYNRCAPYESFKYGDDHD